jgi:hypothetical protein
LSSGFEESIKDNTFSFGVENDGITAKAARIAAYWKKFLSKAGNFD